MKKASVFLIMILILSLSVSLIGCNIKVDPDTGIGTITGELTKLSTPTNVRVESDVIKWSSVSNAGSYIVQIGDESHQAKTSYLEYPISSLLSTSASGLYVQVKALPTSSILYSESDWSELYGPVDYVTSVKGFGDAYVSNSLGRSINLINGTSYVPMAGAVSIFDTAKLYKLDLIEEQIGTQETRYYSGESYDEISDGWALSVEEKLAMDAGVKVGNFLSASMDFGINIKGGYEVKQDSETNQFYYKLYQYITGKRVEIPEFRNTIAIAQMLSTQFLSDARKVNDGVMSADSFVNKYGTHVIMSAFYGGVIEASYYSIQHKSTADQNWYANLETSLTQHLTLGSDKLSMGESFESSFEVDYSQFNNKKSSDRMAEFTAKAIGGTSQSFATMEAFAKSYEAWAKSVNKDTYALIDVPNGSLYCIWDYLDDSYSNAKNILDDYLFTRCNEEYNKIYDKIASVRTKNNVLYDEKTQTLTIDLKDFQSKGTLSNLDYQEYKNGVLTIYPMIGGKEIKNINLIGAYETRDSKGTVITNLISNLTLKFHNDWYSDINLTLESVGFTGKTGMPALDFSQVDSKLNITINILGTNKLLGSNGTNENGATPAIKGNNISITSSATNSVLDCYGGKGKDGAKGKDQYLNPNDGGKVPDTATTSGENGSNGALAIECQKLSILNSATVNIVGGNGGNGGNGGDVCNTGFYDGYADLPDGGAGGKGGNGGAPINQNTQVMLSANANLMLRYGNGGNGGNGGQGGSASQPDNHHGSKPDGKGHGGDAGAGGDGYIGGNSGTGGNGGSTFNNYLNTKAQSQRGTTGDGGKGNVGGNAYACITYTKGIISKDAGTAGKGGRGGYCGNLSWTTSYKEPHWGINRHDEVGSNGDYISVTYNITII